MRITTQVLVATLLRRHPPAHILQAHSDRELNGLAGRLIRRHVQRCDICQDDLRDSMELLDMLCATEPPSHEIVLMRERIVTTIEAASQHSPFAIGDLRRLLGQRAAVSASDGPVGTKVRVELTAFLGTRAAESFLSRLPG